MLSKESNDAIIILLIIILKAIANANVRLKPINIANKHVRIKPNYVGKVRVLFD